MTKIYNFQYPIYDLILNQNPVSDLPYTYFPVETNVKGVVKGFCWSVLSIMMKK